MTRDERGFTLIELVITKVVMALLVWVALPHSFASDVRLNAAARQLQSDIRYAQELAMTRGQHHQIRFYAASNPSPTNQYEIVTAASQAVLHPLSRSSSFVVDFNDPQWAGVQLDSTLTLEFDGLGRPDAAKTISLNGGAKVITVTAETGRVSF